MSTRRKGNRNRRRVQHYFSDIGYITANVEKTGKFVSEKDLFALAQGEEYSDKGFDVLAIKKNKVLLIQVKSNTPAVQAFYKDFAEQYSCSCIDVVVATVIDYKGMRLQYYNPDGSITEDFVDIKDMPLIRCKLNSHIFGNNPKILYIVAGKGDKRRPRQVSREEYERRHEKIIWNKDKKNDSTDKSSN